MGRIQQTRKRMQLVVSSLLIWLEHSSLDPAAQSRDLSIVWSVQGMHMASQGLPQVSKVNIMAAAAITMPPTISACRSMTLVCSTCKPGPSKLFCLFVCCSMPSRPAKQTNKSKCKLPCVVFLHEQKSLQLCDLPEPKSSRSSDWHPSSPSQK